MSDKFEKPSLLTETNVRYSDASQTAEVETVSPVAWLYLNTDVGDRAELSRLDHYYRPKYSILEHDYINGDPLVRQSDHLAALSAVTAERDAVNSRLHEVATLCATVEQERDQLRAEIEALRQAVEPHPFAQKVVAKLRRFEECCEDSDSGGSDIGRHWLDLLTRLGLLNRVQRSPAIWEITVQGEDVLVAMAAKEGDV